MAFSESVEGNSVNTQAQNSESDSDSVEENTTTDNQELTLYDWIPWFRGIAGKLCELHETKSKAERDEQIKVWAQYLKTAKGQPGKIVNQDYLNSVGPVDPFSFINTLSQKHILTRGYFDELKATMQLNPDLTEITDDIYPTANRNTLFHNGTPRPTEGIGSIEFLWKFFCRAYSAENYAEFTDEEIQGFIDNVKQAGRASLTQVLFLVNTDVFLPIDKHIFKQLPEFDEKSGFSTTMQAIFDAFPDKKLYEINRECYLKSKNKGTPIDKKKQSRDTPDRNIIFTGPPGTGKTRLAKLVAEWLCNEDASNSSLLNELEQIKKQLPKDKKFKNLQERSRVQLVQFHPAYSYEDFVRGVAVSTDPDGKVRYDVQNRALAEIAEAAYKNPNLNYVLIIDEINRANLPAVLGELIYALEYRDQEVRSLYELNRNANIIVPNNLYIIGTMNTADRSTGPIDYAIRRRFCFVSVSSDISVIKDKKAKEAYKKIEQLFGKYLPSEFEKDDVMIGHSYFLVKDNRPLNLRWQYEIKPLLREYIKDGILQNDSEETEETIETAIENIETSIK